MWMILIIRAVDVLEDRIVPEDFVWVSLALPKRKQISMQEGRHGPLG